MKLQDFIETLDERIVRFDGYAQKNRLKDLPIDDWISTFATFEAWGDEDVDDEDPDTGWAPEWT